MSKTNGAKRFAEMFRDYGLTHVFYVPQIASRALAAMEEHTSIRRVVAHSEKSAAYMADGYARAKGGIGLCMSQPIGASNLASGLRDAFLASSPVIAISGGPVSISRYRNAYQEVEDISQFDAVTKLNVEVDEPARLEDTLRQAFRVATTGTPGPVHLRFQGRHGDVPLGDCESDGVTETRFAKYPAFRPTCEPELIREAVALLKKAKKPVLIVGGGVQMSGAQAEMKALAEKLQIPVVYTPNGKGVLLDTHPLVLGVVGTYSRICVNKAVAAADLVFFIGSPAGGLATANWRIPAPGVQTIQLDIEADELGRNYSNAVSLAGDAKAILGPMLEMVPAEVPAAHKEWLAEVGKLKAEWAAGIKAQLESNASPIRPERICAELSAALPENGVVVSDTGHAAMWTTTLFEIRHARQRFIRCSGSLGWGIPGAIGVKCALPDQPVVCFTGDGGAYYHLTELETALRHNINVVFLINNNNGLNQELPNVERVYGGVDKGRSGEMWRFDKKFNFADVARAMGCEAMRVEKAEDIGPALQKSFKLNKPVVVEIMSDERAFATTAWVPNP